MGERSKTASIDSHAEKSDARDDVGRRGLAIHFRQRSSRGGVRTIEALLEAPREDANQRLGVDGFGQRRRAVQDDDAM
jgi:hypothetical protein